MTYIDARYISEKTSSKQTFPCVSYHFCNTSCDPNFGRQFQTKLGKRTLLLSPEEDLQFLMEQVCNAGAWSPVETKNKWPKIWQDFVARCLITRGLLSNKLCSFEHRLNQGGPAHLLFWTFLTGMNVTHKAYNIFGKPIPEGSYILQKVDQCVEQN